MQKLLQVVQDWIAELVSKTIPWLRYPGIRIAFLALMVLIGWGCLNGIATVIVAANRTAVGTLWWIGALAITYHVVTYFFASEGNVLDDSDSVDFESSLPDDQLTEHEQECNLKNVTEWAEKYLADNPGMHIIDVHYVRRHAMMNYRVVGRTTTGQWYRATYNPGGDPLFVFSKNEITRSGQTEEWYDHMLTFKQKRRSDYSVASEEASSTYLLTEQEMLAGVERLGKLAKDLMRAQPLIKKIVIYYDRFHTVDTFHVIGVKFNGTCHHVVFNSSNMTFDLSANASLSHSKAAFGYSVIIGSDGVKEDGVKEDVVDTKVPDKVDQPG